MSYKEILSIEIDGIEEIKDATERAAALHYNMGLLRESNKALKKERQEAIKTGKDQTEEFLKAELAIVKNEAAIKKLRSSYNRTSNEIKAVAGSMEGFRAETNQLIERINRFRVGVDGTEKELHGLQKQVAAARQKIIDFDQSMKVGASNVGNYGAAIKSGAKQMLSMYVGWEVLTGAVSSSIAEFKEAEQAQARLEAVLNSTGHAAGVSKEELNSMAQGLQKVTKFGDDTTTAAQALLLTFTNIGKEIFPQATEMTLNLAEALGQDANTAAVQLGKALNDPIRGVSALRRVGVSFTEQQQEQIRVLQTSGDLLGAQSVVLQELEKEFGGVARAAGATSTGALDRFNNKLGDLKEGVGELIVTGISPFTKILSGGMEIINEVTSGVTILVGAILNFGTQGSRSIEEVNEAWREQGDEIDNVLQKLQGNVNFADFSKSSIKELESFRSEILAQMSKVQDAVNPMLQKRLNDLDAILAKKRETAEAGAQAEVKSIESINDKLKDAREAYQQAAIGSDEFYKQQKEVAKLEKELEAVEGKGLEKRKKQQDTYHEDILKLQADVAKSAAGSEANDFDRKRAMAQAETEAAITELQNRKARTAEEQGLINKLIQNLQLELVQNINDINREQTEKEAKQREEKAEKEKQALVNLNASKIEAIEKGLRLEEQALETAFINKEISEKEYNNRLFEARKEALEHQITALQQALQNTGLTPELKNNILTQLEELYAQIGLINAKQDEKETERIAKKTAEINGHIQEAAAGIQAAVDGFAQAEIMNIDMRAQAEIQRINDTMAAQLSATNLTEAQRLDIKTLAEQKIAKIEQDAAKESARARAKYADFDLLAKVASVVSNTAVAVTAALSIPIFGPILAAANAAAGAAQLAIAKAEHSKIKSEAAKFEHGGILKGARHSQGGIPLYSRGGNYYGEAEGGEAIINRRSTAMFRDELSAINMAGGGRPLAPVPHMAKGGLTAPVPMPEGIDYRRLAAEIGKEVGKNTHVVQNVKRTISDVNSIENAKREATA